MMYLWLLLLFLKGKYENSHLLVLKENLDVSSLEQHVNPDHWIHLRTPAMIDPPLCFDVSLRVGKMSDNKATLFKSK